MSIKLWQPAPVYVVAAIGATLLGVGAPTSAENVIYPDVFAEVRLLSCQAIEVGPSPLRLGDLGDTWPRTKDRFVDDQDSKFNGTMLQVQFVDVVQPAGAERSTVKTPGSTWKAGEVAVLVTEQKARAVCVPRAHTYVVTHQRGCDTFPREGHCLMLGMEFVCLNPPEHVRSALRDDPYAFSGRIGCRRGDGAIDD